MGFDDELNRVPADKIGGHFGFPYCHANGQPDPDIKVPNPCANVILPVTVLGAHTAALGMRFYTGKMFPPEYQGAGYALYVYMGAPHATAGLVDPSSWFGAVRVGANTNYFHAVDLSQWDGRYLVATNTNPNDFAPADANLAVFTGLNADTVSIVAEPHPLGLTGPVSLSSFQLVALVVQAVPLNITTVGGVPVLSWTGTWILQTRASLSGGTWQDVTPAATSPYTVPTPLAQQAYFRLRSP